MHTTALTDTHRTDDRLAAALDDAGERADLVFFHQSYPSPTHRWRAHVTDTADGELVLEVDSGRSRHGGDADAITVALAHRTDPGEPLRNVAPAEHVERGTPHTRDRVIEAVEKLSRRGADALTRCDCGGVLTVRHAGPEDTPFYGCSRFPTCDNTEGMSDTPTCPSCGGAMVVRDGGSGQFWGCLNYPDCQRTINRPD